MPRHSYRSPRPRPVILVLGPIEMTMHRQVRRGIHAALAARPCSPINGYETDVRTVRKWIAECQPGAVLLAFPKPTQLAAASLAPTVVAMCDTKDLPIPAIDLDQRAAGILAAEHLMRTGYRSFAVLGQWKRLWAFQRASAFAKRLAEAGLACAWSTGDEFPIVAGGPAAVSHAAASGPALMAWLRSLPKPVAIFACCDAWGQHLAMYCRALSLHVPQDVAIVSMDNDVLFCEITHPPLSSVAVPWRQIGYEAAILAHRLAEGRRVKPGCRLLSPIGVVTRQSSDVLACDDPEVAEALRIIRTHADRSLGVAELLRKLPVHRRRLERRFHDLLGRSILYEIRRAHVERAKQLLISTDQPIGEIARASGFASASKFSIAFHKETGQTSRFYRRELRSPD